MQIEANLFEAYSYTLLKHPTLEKSDIVKSSRKFTGKLRSSSDSVNAEKDDAYRSKVMKASQ